MGVHCTECGAVVRCSLQAVKNHLNDSPHNSPFCCVQEDCKKRKFLVKSSFIRHLKEYHGVPEEGSDHSSDSEHSSSESSSSSSGSSSTTVSSSSGSSPPSASGDSTGGSQQDCDNDDGIIHSDNDSDDYDEEDFNSKLEREAALLVLNLRRRGNVTGVAITAFAEESQRLIDAIVSATQKEIAKNLTNAGVDQAVIENCVSKVPPLSPFKKLLRKDQQMNYFEKHFNLIRPVPKFLGYREETTTDEAGNNIPQVIRTIFHYISVKKILVAVLSNPHLYALIHSEKKSTDGKIRSFLDGTAAKDNPLVDKYPFTIRMTLHADDFDPSNSLGAKAGVHKTTEVNMQIQNLPPEENARLRSIFVVAYAYRQDLQKETGIDPLLEPIIEEMEELESEDGVIISLNRRPYVLRATFVAVAADDLEAHEMCGLLSPSANRFCTHCLVCRPDMHRDIFAMGELRTKELHSFHIEELKNKPKKFITRSYGLERKSSLLKISKYTSFPEAAIKDGMHDILRGIAPMEISLALHELCHKQKLFKVEALNNAIQRFQYGPADSRNKPTANFTEDAISKQGSYSLHQSAAQTWCLLQVFPFIMVSLTVPAVNPHVKMVVLLKQICEIIFSPEVSEADMQCLEERIHEHHTLFFQLYPPPATELQDEEGEEEENINDNYLVEEEVDDPNSQPSTSSQPPQRTLRTKKSKVIRPINKHHHLFHYVHLIKAYGPSVLYWCMRFEGKHAGAVRFAKIVNNYKCLTKTFSDWQQFNQCAEMLEWQTSVKQEISFSKGNVMTVARSPYCTALLESGLDINSVVEVAKEVKVGGFLFEKGLFVHLPFVINNLPSFGMIRSLCVHENELYVITEDCTVVEYDKNFGAYLLDSTSEASVIRAFLWKNLPQNQPMSKWTADSISYHLSPRRTLTAFLVEPEN